jgi:transposase, IS5 family
MRVAQPQQMILGEVDISQIQFNPKSRDDIPRILKGLQYVYMNADLRKAIFDLLEAEFQPKINKQIGRPGLSLWNILVLGVIRLDLNADYDRVLELANEHLTLRQMLGHGIYSDDKYHYQTIVDNISQFTPELLDKLNTLVVKEGHVLAKKGEEALRGRCDSFVVESNIHYPTDITLLSDAIRKAILLIGRWSEEAGQTQWRQYHYNALHFKRLVRTTQSQKHRKGNTESQLNKVKQAHEDLLNIARQHLVKIQEAAFKLMELQPDLIRQQELQGWLAHAQRQINQIDRRVIQGEIIPHDEKVFSIFEPHTEWISKGKAGVPVELGMRVCIMEDQYRFILHHRVMEKETDDKVAVIMVKKTQEKFTDLESASFDKGFHSHQNQEDLAQLLKQVGLPRKGKLSEVAREYQQSEAFKQARYKHSAVESAINALEVHGLDMCPDVGIHGFKRYVALAVLTRNIHRIGDIVWQRDQERERRRQAAMQGHLNRKAA